NRRSSRLKDSIQTTPGFYKPTGTDRPEAASVSPVLSTHSNFSKSVNKSKNGEEKRKSEGSAFSSASSQSASIDSDDLRDCDGFRVPKPIHKRIRETLIRKAVHKKISSPLKEKRRPSPSLPYPESMEFQTGLTLDADILNNEEDFAKQLQRHKGSSTTNKNISIVSSSTSFPLALSAARKKYPTGTGTSSSPEGAFIQKNIQKRDAPSLSPPPTSSTMQRTKRLAKAPLISHHLLKKRKSSGRGEMASTAMPLASSISSKPLRKAVEHSFPQKPTLLTSKERNILHYGGKGAASRLTGVSASYKDHRYFAAYNARPISPKAKTANTAASSGASTAARRTAAPSYVFDLIQKNKLEIHHFTSSWTNYALGSHEESCKAVILLLNLICESAGMGPSFFPLASIEEFMKKEELPTHVLEAFIEKESLKNIQGIMSGKKMYSKQNLEKVCKFFNEFTQSLESDLLFAHSICFSIFQKWIFQLSLMKARRLRYCASLMSLAIMEGLLSLFWNINNSEIKFRRQLNTEIKRLSKKECMKSKVVADLMEKVKTMRHTMAAIKQFFDDQYTLLFTNKKNWFHYVPQWLLDPSYSNYIAWTLCDKESSVRLASLDVFQTILDFSKESHVDKAQRIAIKEFLQYCKNRLLQMRLDVHTAIQKKIIQIIFGMAELSILNPSEIEKILDTFWRCKDSTVIDSFTIFMDKFILKESIFSDEASSEEIQPEERKKR
ncbi:putative Cohesin subunit psc3, partial [Cardiosporidium cionae]